MQWLSADVTGWGAFASLALFFIYALVRERIVLPKSADRLLEAERDRADFYKAAVDIERQRNDVLVGGLVDIVKEIRAAVSDPKRPL